MRDRRAGKQRLYGLDARGLRPVHEWTGGFERFWNERFDRWWGPGRIALLHGESRDDANAFESVLTFEPDGAATRVEMRAVFPTKELRDEAVEKFHAIEGGRQTLSKLAAYVTEVLRKGAEG